MAEVANSRTIGSIVETVIEEVTVFTKQAMVMRRGKTSLEVEANKLVTDLIVTNLPIALEADSVRASGKGTAAVKILGVRTERVYAVEAMHDSVAELETQIQNLQEQQDLLKSQQAALNLQLDFVKNLGEKSVERFAQGLARQQLELTQADNLLNFVGTRWNQTSQEIAEKLKQQQNLEKQLGVLRQRLAQLNTPFSRQSFSLFVTIEAANSGEFDLEVSYFIKNVSWTPFYDLRVDTATSKVNLTYLAEVEQRTGEDWNNVQLTLSTAKLGLGTLPPHLEPWYIDIYRPVPVIPQAPPSTMRLRTQSAMPLMAAAPMGAGIASESFSPAQTIAADVSNEGGVVTFKVARRSDIPSDGQPHKTTILADDYKAKLDFIVMPKLVTQAYLRASVTNGTAQLLPGQANIFRNNNFLGKTNLDSIAPSEEFKLNLGIDESIKIERQLVEREVDKTFVGNQRRTTYAYRISLTNLLDNETLVEVSDQLPVSRNEQIKVKLTRNQPPAQSGELGLLEWKVSLPAKAKREIYFQFTVEQPREATIEGLKI